MRAARLQSNDLGRTDTFFGSLLSKEDIRENDKPPAVEAPKGPQVNGTSLPFRTDPKPRFSDPPAPPPQQPLPEKPDVARAHNFEPSSPSLKRTSTERPRSVPNASPVRQEPTSQILTLVEALASAKKEIDIQSARMRDLEEMLQKERQAREAAEEAAKRLELLQSEPKTNGHVKSDEEGSVPAPDETVVNPKAVSESTLLLEKQLESMLGDMQELRNQMETFKQRAETAESERDAERNERKTLAEMVEKIRLEESVRRSSSTERARSPASGDLAAQHLLNGKDNSLHATLGPLLEKAGLTNGSAVGSPEDKELGRSAVGTLSRSPGGHPPILYNTTPYASMLGVVLIGMGVMAYLNGWQPPKVDR
jgi:phosphatidylserine/phosphatidylglycerophosphate/cardiolipin synthase-like enzyme